LVTHVRQANNSFCGVVRLITSTLFFVRLGKSALFAFASMEKNFCFINLESVSLAKDKEFFQSYIHMLRLRLNSIFVLLLFSFTSAAIAQSKPAYQLYQANGKKVRYSKMLKKLGKADIVFFGELHNSAIAHWLELELAIDLNKRQAIQLGAEMLEADNQASLDAYLKGEIDAAAYKEQTRLWQNYPTDYAPIVDWAKENKIPFTATNIPRRFANMVYKDDFVALDSLTDLERSWIAPLPIPLDMELETYQEILSMMGDHGTPMLVKAQAIKDATMAHFILKNKQPNRLFLHYNGAFHTNKHEGIVWYIREYDKELKMQTITTVEQSDIGKLKKENRHLADFILVVPETMTKTY